MSAFIVCLFCLSFGIAVVSWLLQFTTVINVFWHIRSLQYWDASTDRWHFFANFLQTVCAGSDIVTAGIFSDDFSFCCMLHSLFARCIYLIRYLLLAGFPKLFLVAYWSGCWTRGSKVQFPVILLLCDILRQFFTHASLSLTKLYNLVLFRGLWFPMAEKVTVSLALHWPCITDFVV